MKWMEPEPCPQIPDEWTHSPLSMLKDSLSKGESLSTFLGWLDGISKRNQELETQNQILSLKLKLY